MIVTSSGSPEVESPTSDPAGDADSRPWVPAWRGSLVPVVFALVSGGVLWSSRNPRETFGPSSSDIISAGAVPVALFAALGVLCLAQLVTSTVSRAREEVGAVAGRGPDWRRIAVFCLWFATSVVLIQVVLSVDLTLGVVGFATGWAFFAGQRGRVGLVVVALASAVIVNVLVHFTNSPVASLL